MPDLIIRKLDPGGREIFRYPADRVLARTDSAITVEAIFTRYERLELGYTTFERGDQFIEHFYSDRWYNVFEIRAVGDGHLRGWYCNIARPAEITEDGVAQVDLALDVWVWPDGSALVLDEDEFAALNLGGAEAEAARSAVSEIQDLARRKVPPFASAAPE
mgnify:CR=1 FL=1